MKTLIEDINNAQKRLSHIYREDFSYKTKNPYNDFLKEFSDFILRDEEAEKHKGNWKNIFQNDNPIHAEIGSGFGDFMLDYCANNPDINFVGLDYQFKRTYNFAKKLKDSNLKNFRYLRARGERINFIFGEEEIEKIFLFFPDPWPKARHHKKRIVQIEFLNRVWNVLKKNGRFYIKTDHDEYFEWINKIVELHNKFKMNVKSFDYDSQFKTKFEKIFISQGINIKALELEKIQ